MALGTDDMARRTAAKRFNACLALAADSWNTLVLAVLIVAIVTPIVETGNAAAAISPINGVIAIWCAVLHLLAYLIVRLSKGE